MLIFRNCFVLARSLVMFHNHFHIQVYYLLLISINISKHKQHQHQQHHQATPHSAAVSALSLCFIQHGAQHFACPQWLYRTFAADYRDLSPVEPHLYMTKTALEIWHTGPAQGTPFHEIPGHSRQFRRQPHSSDALLRWFQISKALEIKSRCVVLVVLLQ